jgi:hypothetical protein
MYNENFRSDLQMATILYEDLVQFHTIHNDRPDIILAVIQLTFKKGLKGYLIVRKGYPEEDTIVINPPVQISYDDGRPSVTGIYQSSERIALLVCQMLNDINNKTKGR